MYIDRVDKQLPKVRKKGSRRKNPEGAEEFSEIVDSVLGADAVNIVQLNKDDKDNAERQQTPKKKPSPQNDEKSQDGQPGSLDITV